MGFLANNVELYLASFFDKPRAASFGKSVLLLRNKFRGFDFGLEDFFAERVFEFDEFVDFENPAPGEINGEHCRAGERALDGDAEEGVRVEKRFDGVEHFVTDESREYTGKGYLRHGDVKIFWHRAKIFFVEQNEKDEGV